MSTTTDIIVRKLGIRDYPSTWDEMKAFNERRGEQTLDEIWLLQHEPVYTLGLSGKPEHILDAANIPVVHCDRGGQVTYHGPGQVIVYTLLDIGRRCLSVKALIKRLEQSVINLLQTYGVEGHRRDGAPGVYVAGAKIAALGLRVRKGCCYHGLSLNVDMDLGPFNRINPCGIEGLESTMLKPLISDRNRDCRLDVVADQLAGELLGLLAP